MSEIQAKSIQHYVSLQGMQDIDSWIAKYPITEKQSAVMRALMVVQEENGYLTPEMMNAVASYLEMAAISVYEVASFYSMYELKPVGEHVINVCTNISCKLRNCESIVEHLKHKLQINVGETTKDGLFTLREVECLAACANAPVMQLDKTYHEDLTIDKVDTILQSCQRGSCDD